MGGRSRTLRRSLGMGTCLLEKTGGDFMNSGLTIKELNTIDAPGAGRDFVEGFVAGITVVGVVCAFFGC